MTAALKLPTAAQDVAQDLEAAVRFSRSERDVETVLEGVQAAFEAGHLSPAQAERLAALTMDTARLLARELVNVPASAFLEGPA